jgi:Radical SAM superfamily
MPKDLYCALASNSVSFGPTGGSRPCCAVDTEYWREWKHILPNFNNELVPWFNNPDIVQIREDLLNGKWNPACNMCKVREAHGQPSHRMIFNTELDIIEKRTGTNWHDTNSVITDLSKIFLLDVTVGNKCNSACLMCNPAASSLWAKEQEEITGKKFTWLGKNWFAEQHIPALLDHLPNLEKIQFVGGEPTISSAHIFLLQRLIDSGKSKNISLGYVTNLTGVSEELLELWGHFATKHITISIDGVGPVNEYIRYPFTWKKVMEQLDNLKKISRQHGNYNIGLSHTVTSLNLSTLDTMLEWWESQMEPAAGIYDSLPHIQCVNNPDYFNPLYAPIELKNETYLSLGRLEKFAAEHNLESKYMPMIENIKTNILEKNVDEKVRKDMWLKMQNFIILLDKYRNRDIFKYLPYMKNYWITE